MTITSAKKAEEREVMRIGSVILVFVLTLTSGCLWGSGSAKTRTVYRHDDGVHPVVETSLEQTYDGDTFGASLPAIVLGASAIDPKSGVPYGAAPNGLGGGYGGGASTLCVSNPERCAAPVTVTAQQPSILVTGDGSSGSSLQVSAGGEPQVLAAGQPGTYAPRLQGQGDLEELQERLLSLERRAAIITPALKEQLRVQCQIILAQPALIKDEGSRVKLVHSCTNASKK